MSRTEKLSVNEYTWIEISITGKKRIPKWVKRCALASDGTVYIAAALFASEAEAFLCASYDGIAVLQHNGHLYIPTGWAKREYRKDMADLIESVERRVREHLAEANNDE